MGYIDEQICSRLTGSAKTTCQHIIETNGRELLDDIKCGTVMINIKERVISSNQIFALLEINASLHTFSNLYRSSSFSNQFHLQSKSKFRSIQSSTHDCILD